MFSKAFFFSSLLATSFLQKHFQLSNSLYRKKSAIWLKQKPCRKSYFSSCSVTGVLLVTSVVLPMVKWLAKETMCLFFPPQYSPFPIHSVLRSQGADPSQCFGFVLGAGSSSPLLFEYLLSTLTNVQVCLQTRTGNITGIILHVNVTIQSLNNHSKKWYKISLFYIDE